ncbi:hypothetical protein ACFC1B_29560, partial [Streptomyces xiamenensis]|uniref:hypothetical protein n=1 Tax=Streptomyces xiamenensis TaxID=408015 RepID=UPI0035D794C9
MFTAIRRRLFGTDIALTDRADLREALDSHATHPANLTTALDSQLAFQPGLTHEHGRAADLTAYLGTLARRATELGEADLAYHLGTAAELADALREALREAAL